MGVVDPFLGEIHMFGGNFAPSGWAFCDGQILPIQQYTALFSLLGTTFGGNGINTFALPDLRGRVPIHPGQGPGLSQYALGEFAGTENVGLLSNQVPPHTHLLAGNTTVGNSPTPSGNTWAASSSGFAQYATPAVAGATVPMAPTMVQPNGGNQPHNNMQPSLTLNFIICLSGAFPSRP